MILKVNFHVFVITCAAINESGAFNSYAGINTDVCVFHIKMSRG